MFRHILSLVILIFNIQTKAFCLSFSLFYLSFQIKFFDLKQLVSPELIFLNFTICEKSVPGNGFPLVTRPHAISNKQIANVSDDERRISAKIVSSRVYVRTTATMT